MTSLHAAMKGGGGKERMKRFETLYAFVICCIRNRNLSRAASFHC